MSKYPRTAQALKHGRAELMTALHIINRMNIAGRPEAVTYQIAEVATQLRDALTTIESARDICTEEARGNMEVVK